MSHKGNTETFYREIMSKVIEKMKEDFNNEGISEDILNQLKKVFVIKQKLDLGRKINLQWDISA